MDIRKAGLALGGSKVVSKLYHAPVSSLEVYELELLSSCLFSVTRYQLCSTESAEAKPASDQPRRRGGVGGHHATTLTVLKERLALCHGSFSVHF